MYPYEIPIKNKDQVHKKTRGHKNSIYSIDINVAKDNFAMPLLYEITIG